MILFSARFQMKSTVYVRMKGDCVCFIVSSTYLLFPQFLTDFNLTSKIQWRETLSMAPMMRYEYTYTALWSVYSTRNAW